MSRNTRSRQRRRKTARVAAAGGGLAVVATVLSGTAAQAEPTIMVRSDSGAAAGVNAGTQIYSGAETLADAVAYANANGGGTITFASSLSGSTGNTIDLTTGAALAVTEPATIAGDNAITLDGEGNQIFHICADAGQCSTAATQMTTLSGLTLTDGGTTNHYIYTAIEANSPLTLQDVTISGNAGIGSAVASYADLYVDDSTFSGNVNTGVKGAGAIEAFGGLAVENSTFYNNVGPYAGAVYSHAFHSVLVGDTIDGNRATAQGETLQPLAGGLANVVAQPYWTVDLDDSIVAQNTASGNPSDIAGQINAEFSLIGDDTGTGATTDSTDLTGTATTPLDPGLGPLSDNGGPTQTMTPRSGSPALASGNAYNFTEAIPQYLFNVDQIGNARVGTGSLSSFTGTDFTEMGAVEVPPAALVQFVSQPAAPTVAALSKPSGAPGRTITITGANFEHVEAVRFGSTATSFTVLSPTEIAVSVPAGTACSKVDVQVTTLSGQSPLTVADRFVFYGTQTKKAKRANQRITLTTAASTVPIARSDRLAVKFKTAKAARKTKAKVARSAPKLTFKRVVYQFAGVKTKHVYRRRSGTDQLALGSLKPGKHTLKSTVYYTERIGTQTKTVHTMVKAVIDIA